MVAKLTAAELLEMDALSNLEEEIIYLCQKFETAQNAYNAAFPQAKRRVMELHSDFLSKSVVVQFAFPLESDTFTPETVGEIFPSEDVPPPPPPQIPIFLPYVPSAISALAFFGGENGGFGLAALNDGSSDTSLSLEAQRGAKGMIEFDQPCQIRLTFATAVRIKKIRILLGQFNGSNYNIPTGFTLYQGETTAQTVYAFTGFVDADGLAFREFDLSANVINASIYRIDFSGTSGGTAVSVYELQFFGLT